MGIILAIALGLLIAALVQYLKYREKKEKAVRPVRRFMTPQLLAFIKNQYAGKLRNLQNEYSQNMISKREGYQRLSLLIRGFVHEVTGINVENYTKKEIQAMGIKKLDMLMEEYYVPEFAEDEKARNKDFNASCNTAMGVIGSWS